MCDVMQAEVNASAAYLKYQSEVGRSPSDDPDRHETFIANLAAIMAVNNDPSFTHLVRQSLDSLFILHTAQSTPLYTTRHNIEHSIYLTSHGIPASHVISQFCLFIFLAKLSTQVQKSTTHVDIAEMNTCLDICVTPLGCPALSAVQATNCWLL
jgi:hypothetical protein